MDKVFASLKFELQNYGTLFRIEHIRHPNMAGGTYNTLKYMFATALQEIKCTVMYCMFPLPYSGV